MVKCFASISSCLSYFAADVELFVLMFGKKEQYNDVGHWSKQNQNVGTFM